jgi:glutathione S-transferase
VTIVLYHSPFSTCSQKVRLCLAEKRLDYVDHRIAFANNEHLTPDYLSINPNGVVPTLVHEGRPIVDSSVICEYLDDVFAEPSLTHDTAIETARMRSWMRYFEEVPTVAIRVPSFNGLFSDFVGKMSDDEFQEHMNRLPLRKHFYAKMQKGKFSDEENEAALERLASSLDRVERALTNSTWIAGEIFSLADIVFIPTIIRMEDIGLSSMWEARPRISEWLNNVKLRDSFDVAFFPGSRIRPSDFEIEAAEANLALEHGSESQAGKTRSDND